MTEPKPPTMRDYLDAWARAGEGLRPAFQSVARALRPLAEFAASPQGQALIAAAEQDRRRRELERGCHCLCAVSHPDQHEACLGEVLERDLAHVRYNSPTVGRHDVPMCQPCADATLTAAAR